MFFPATINPHADAERHFDALFDAGEAAEARETAEARRLSDAFVSALPLGENEPLEGQTIADALCDIACSDYCEMLNEIVVVAGDSTDPALRKIIRKLGDAWADLTVTRAVKKGGLQ